MRTLVGSVRHYPNWGGRKARDGKLRYYAQSWLAVHYIQSTPGWTDKLGTYLQGIPVAKDPHAFFTECFEVTPEGFGKLLRAYFKKNSYSGRRIPLDPSVGVVPITTRKLDKGETEFKRGEAVRRFRGGEDGRELAEKYYGRSEAADGPLAQVQASRALLALRADNVDLAVEKATQAYALSPEDARVAYVLGKVKVAQYSHNEANDESTLIKDARRLFKKSMRANPDNLQPHFDYVMSYNVLGDEASKQALYSAKESTVYYRSPDFIGGNMRLVTFFLQNEETDYALFHLKRAKYWAHTPSARRAAAMMIKSLEDAD